MSSVRAATDLPQAMPGDRVERARPARLNGWPSYLLAIAVTGATLLARFGLSEVLETEPALVIFTIPIMVSAYYGGLGPGLLSTALSLLGGSYFFLGPVPSLRVASITEVWHQALVVIAGVTISLLNEALHRAHRRADAAMLRHHLATVAFHAGVALKVTGTCQDVTERKEADASRARLAAILESTTDLVGVWTPDGNLTYLNRAARAALGIGADEDVKGATLAASLPDAARHPTLTDGVPAASRDGTWRGKVELLRRDGKRLPVSQVIIAHKAADGHVESYSSVMRDITAQQEAEQALRRQSEMLDSVGLAIIATDPAGHIIYANRFAGELYGWPIADVLGKNIMDVTVLESSREEAEQIMTKTRSGDSWSGEYTVCRADGTRFPALVTTTALHNALGEVTGVIGISSDISARKEEERRLEQLSQTTARRERLLNTTLSSMNDFAYAYDRDARLLFVNQPLLDLWGLRLEDALGKSFLELGYPAELAMRLEREVAEVFATKLRLTGETDYTNPAGLTGYYEYILSPALADDGSVDFVVGTTRDISERKRTENQIAKRHKHLRDLIDGLGPAIFVGLLTPDGILIEVNRAPLDAAGLKEDDVLGKSLADTHWWQSSPEARAQLRAAIALAARGEPSRYDVRALGARGQFIDIDFSLQPMRDAAGQVVFLIPSATVITERKRAEQSLQQNLELYRKLVGETARVNAELYASEQKFRELADNVSDAFFIYSADRQTVHYISPAYEKIWGRPAELLYANPRQWRDAIVPADRAALFAAVDRVGIDTPALTAEFRICRPDGTERWVQMEVSEVRDEAGDLVRLVGTCSDITARRNSEEQLEKTHRLLLDSSRKAGMAEIATNVLHNVGNVLNSVNVSASLAVENVRSSRTGRMGQVIAMMRTHEADLGDYITSDPVGQHIPAFLEDLSGEWSRQQEVLITELESLRANIDHIKHIVAMQQSYARISGTTEIVELEDLVEDALRVQRGALDEYRIRIVREFERIEPITIARHKVLPILVNLLRNAKHACHALPDTDRRITLRIAAADDRIRISVEDDGVGIAPENMTRIFSHGFTTRKDGHGFGLHSGALAATELGGSLSVVSDGLGMGATFTLEVPIHPPEEIA